MTNWKLALSPSERTPGDSLSVELASNSKRLNFQNRTESAESKASERNGPFGEKQARFIEQPFRAGNRNRCYYWA
jgi:hypothetical protein